jgi:hypothetical protein
VRKVCDRCMDCVHKGAGGRRGCHEAGLLAQCDGAARRVEPQGAARWSSIGGMHRLHAHATTHNAACDEMRCAMRTIAPGTGAGAQRTPRRIFLKPSA